jgi:hypothetical protein
MTVSASGFIRMFSRPVGVIFLAGAMAGGVGAAWGQPRTPDEVRRERARNRLQDNRPAQEREAEAPRDLPPVDPALVAWYQATVTELASPAYEGRSPGSAGIERAATLIENRFKELGLRPIFDADVVAADGTEVIDPASSYRQAFSIGQDRKLTTASVVVDGEALTDQTDYAALAYSGSGKADAAVVFTGYSIVSGPGGFMGFDANTRLDGKIALCLKYEPMDADGRSLWQADDGFSHHAAMTHKASALIRRGASAVLIVAPAHAQDGRDGTLESVESTTMTRAGLGAEAPRFDAPVLNITPEVAQRIIDRVGDPDLTLASLVERSNQGAVLVPLGEQPISVRVDMETTEHIAVNIGGVLPGVGDLAEEYVVIGAHYDHVGFGGRNSLARDSDGQLHPGADDNASGTTGMLLAAQLVTERVRLLPPEQERRSFIFLAFSAEEIGLLGSLHYVREPAFDIRDHVLMLNLDMIGRLEEDLLELGGLDSAPGLEDFADPFLEASGLPVARDTSVGNGRSDHASFDGEEVPNIFFFTGLHDQYHRPADTADLIDHEGGVRVSLLATEIGMAMATRAEPFIHKRLAGREDQGPKPPTVRLGVLPTNSTKGGVLVQRVFPDTSASEAGLQPDDRILTWNGEELRNTEDLRPKLSEHAPGDEVILTVERGDQTVEVRMILRGIE